MEMENSSFQMDNTTTKASGWEGSNMDKGIKCGGMGK